MDENLNDFLRFDFIGCGALNWDIFFELEDLQILKEKNIHASPGGEIALERKDFIEVLNFLEKRGNFLFEGGGGSAANTLYALSLWGFKGSFLGAVGKDPFGKKVLEEFSSVGLSLEYIIERGTTSLALIVLSPAKDRFILVSPGDAENYLPVLIEKNLPKGDYHFSSFASAPGRHFQVQLLTQINRISFDPGRIYVSLGWDNLLSWLKATKYLFITEEELGLLKKAPDSLLNLGIEKVFLKQGKNGAMVFTKDKVFKKPSLNVDKVVDNTGAGDYFNAGVLAGISLGFNEDKALELGIYAAGMSLRDYGRRGCLDKREFQNYVSLLKLTGKL